VCRALVGSQPSMASLLNLANTVLLETERIRGLDEVREGVRRSAGTFLERMEVEGQAAGNTAANLIQDGMTVMTHSASQTVLSAVLRAAVLGRRVRVIATESRPGLEGVVLAKNLGKAGIAVTLIVDACMLRCLPEADLVLVGADAVTGEVVVNKAGTSALALAAGKLEKRMYALAGPEKFLPPGYRLPEEKPKEPREVLRKRRKNVAVRNLYFDQTPLGWLAGVVSGDQILNATRIRQRLRSMNLHEALT
jgi:translation initiation factor eIF-2B subunit delta